MDREADAEADQAGEAHDRHDVGRMLTFSDGVFAIAITLLVLDIPVPELAHKDVPAHLLGAVADLAPRFLAFAFSFLLVGFYWNIHRRLFRRTVRTNGWLNWLNLLLLMGICLVPFSSALVSRYGDSLPGMELYAANLTLIALLTGTVRFYGERKQLMGMRSGKPASIGECYGHTAVFVLGMAVAPVSVFIGYATWALAFPAYSLGRRLVLRVTRPGGASSGTT